MKKHRFLSLLTAVACTIATMVGATFYTAAEEAEKVEETVQAVTYETECSDVQAVSNEIGLSTTTAVTTQSTTTTTTTIPTDTTSTTTTTTFEVITMISTTVETRISVSGAYIHNETVTVGDGIPHMRSGEYSSSDESVVAINEYGNPVAVGVGTAGLSIMQGNLVVESVYVTVVEPVAVTTSVTSFIDISTHTIINTTTIEIVTSSPPVMSTNNLIPIMSKTVCVGDIVDDSDDISYFTDNEEVVAINEDGLPVAVGVGKALIKVYSSSIDKYYYINVTVSLAVGDISGDGEINLYDAVEIAKSIMGMRTFTDEEMQTADYNGDGEVNLYDVIEIAKLIME